MRSKKKNTGVDLSKYRVKAIKEQALEYILAKPVAIIDEGSFYRIDGTYIIDKFKIESVNLEGEVLTVNMRDKTVIFAVEL